MNKNFKVAFYGTSDRSVPILEALKDNFKLVLCVTKDDSKVGRKQELRETQVKVWARENEVASILVSNLTRQKEDIIKHLQELEVDLAVIADFSFMIPQPVIDAPKLKTINVHFSLLPKLRGASPVQHTILNGLAETGITYYLMDAGMDTGEILNQIPYKLTGNETAGALYDDMFKLAAAKLPEVIHGYVSGKLVPHPQDDSKATYCYSKTNPKSTIINKRDARIDWDESAEIIERQVRAYTPWPISWTTLGELDQNPKLTQEVKLKESVDKNLTVKIFEASLKDGKLNIEQLQIAGKNKTDLASFFNGYSIN